MNVQQHNHDKGQHYLDLLDAARSEAKWGDVPELTRKVEKHAPRRICLILAARVEAQIASKTRDRPVPPSRPGTPSLIQHIGPLSSAIENERTYPEDALQARICLAWLHLILGASGLALQHIPSNLLESFNAPNRESTAPKKTRCLHISLVRGGYIKGVCLENAGKVGDAIAMYDTILPQISQSQSLVAIGSEYNFWANQLLLRYCRLCTKYLESTPSDPQLIVQSPAPISPSGILKPYRTWASLNSSQASRSSTTSYSQSPRQIWQAYYKAVSTILALRPISIRTPQVLGIGSTRDFDEMFGFESTSRQLLELRQAEAAYEVALFRDYGFPQANETHIEIDDFIDQVIANWQVVLGSDFVDDDLGDGGKISYTRKVTATLYASAKKSFHSTRLLRHLFTVHTALAEFDLAGKALRSYFQIVKHGQARAEKSGKPEAGLDDDATVLVTASSAIQMLCQYGRRDEAEFANEIAEYITKWLDQHSAERASEPNADAEDIPKEMATEKSSPRSKVAGRVVAMAYRARGQAQCHWARLTYETEKRSKFYQEAVQDFRHSLQLKLDDSDNVASAYALAVALTETREVGAAIGILKRALSTISEQDGEIKMGNGALPVSNKSTSLYAERGQHLRCWHLMALLLSAREKFTAAIESCKAGVELYDEELSQSDSSGLDKTQLSEKTSILELMITHLSLTEVVDGPEEALNRSDELLRLYAKLFRHASPPRLAKPETRIAPLSANGTVTSLRHSILGRSKKPFASLRRSLHPDRPVSAIASTESPSSPLDLTRPPTINITDDEGATVQENHLSTQTFARHGSKKLQKRDSKRNVGSFRRSYNTSPVRLSALNSAPPTSSSLPMRSSRPASRNAAGAFVDDGVGLALSVDPPASSSELSDPVTKFATAGQSSISANLQTAQYPEPLYSFHLLQRHSLTLLTKIWLFISSLYHRASISADALAAISEAETHVKTIETLVATHENSSEEAFTTPGWGGLKSVAELWADVLTARAVIKRDGGDKELASRLLEEALLWDEDHLAATVALSEMLMDEYEVFFTPPAPPTPIRPPTLKALPQFQDTPKPPSNPTSNKSGASTNSDPSPETLSAISARDRAYFLLGQLTTSGQGWDSSEAWSAMARVWELSGEEEKAIESSWWVVELEGNRGVRSWRESLGKGCLDAQN